MKKIGIFPGTFDPVHDGHIEFAKQSMKTCGLESIYFLPEKSPRNKPNATSYTERLQALKNAIVRYSFEVFESRSNRFTVESTLPELISNFPETQFTFLIGSDVATSLRNWKDLQKLTDDYRFVVGMRNDDNEDDIRNEMQRLGARHDIIKTTCADISSRAIRSMK